MATTPDSLSQRMLVTGWPILLEITLSAVIRLPVLLSGMRQKLHNFEKTSQATSMWTWKEVEFLVFLAPGCDLTVTEGMRSICIDPSLLFGFTLSGCILPGNLARVLCSCFLQGKQEDLTSFRILFVPRIQTQLLYFSMVFISPKWQPDADRLYGKCELIWASDTIEKDSELKTDNTKGHLEICFLSM